MIRTVEAPSGERIAYASVGSGPLLVMAAWWTSHLELDWDDPGFREFVSSLAQRHTVVRYDRPGVGLSDRGDRRYDLDGETEYLRAVVDAALSEHGGDQIDLLGISCGGPASVRLAAEEPDRVRRLVLFASYVTGDAITDEGTRTALTDLVRANWGMGSTTLTSIFLPDAESEAVRRFNRAQRATTTADVAADLLDLTFTLDAAPFVADVDVPTLVVHRRRDQVIPSEHGRRLAEAIPDAEYCELEGKVHVPWTADNTAALSRIEEFLTGQAALAPPKRRLATIAFVDIVDSTEQLAELGDGPWSERLDELTRVLSDEARGRSGTIVKDTGDGALATFDLPGDAFAWAIAVRARSTALGLPVRVGIHMGEVELRGDDVTGISVVIASRVMDQAAADEILATATTAELAAGGGIDTLDAGEHDLKGIAGRRTLVSIAPLSDRPGAATARAATAPAIADGAATSAAAEIIRFDGYELDAAAFELRHDGAAVDVEPQVFEVLRYLAQRPGELVTKEQLLDDVWGDRFVSESSLSSRIRSARLAVGDDGQRQTVIKTIHGRGFRFVADLD